MKKLFFIIAHENLLVVDVESEDIFRYAHIYQEDHVVYKIGSWFVKRVSLVLVGISYAVIIIPAQKTPIAQSPPQTAEAVVSSKDAASDYRSTRSNPIFLSPGEIKNSTPDESISNTIAGGSTDRPRSSQPLFASTTVSGPQPVKEEPSPPKTAHGCRF